MAQAKAEAVRKMVEKKMGRKKYVKEELERLRQRAAVAAEEIHTGSKDLADPEVTLEKKKKPLRIKPSVASMRSSKMMSWDFRRSLRRRSSRRNRRRRPSMRKRKKRMRARTRQLLMRRKRNRE